MVRYHRCPTPILADTHESRAFKIVLKYVRVNKMKKPIEWVANNLGKPVDNSLDPFARNCPAFSHTNDIDPNTKAQTHLDALVFMQAQKTLEREFDLIWFDPPFSSRQSNEIYEGHVNVYTDPGYLKRLYSTIPYLLSKGGFFVKWGYNTNNPMPSILKLEDLFMFPQGANKNDVLVSIYRRTAEKIEGFDGR